MNAGSSAVVSAVVPSGSPSRASPGRRRRTARTSRRPPRDTVHRRAAVAPGVPHAEVEVLRAQHLRARDRHRARLQPASITACQSVSCRRDEHAVTRLDAARPQQPCPARGGLRDLGKRQVAHAAAGVHEPERERGGVLLLDHVARKVEGGGGGHACEPNARGTARSRGEPSRAVRARGSGRIPRPPRTARRPRVRTSAADARSGTTLCSPCTNNTGRRAAGSRSISVRRSKCSPIERLVPIDASTPMCAGGGSPHGTKK